MPLSESLDLPGWYCEELLLLNEAEDEAVKPLDDELLLEVLLKLLPDSSLALPENEVTVEVLVETCMACSLSSRWSACVDPLSGCSGCRP